jgi:L-alanine-DL-glutamate epimerase-like enolase superfamily enzyme
MCIGRFFNYDGTLGPREIFIRLTELVRGGFIDVLAVSPAETGGLNGFTRAAAICEGAGVEVVVSRTAGSISQAAWLAACITSFSASYAQDIYPMGNPSGVLQDIVSEPLTHRDGYMKAPEGPGYDLDPDWDAVAACCIGTESAGYDV